MPARIYALAKELKVDSKDLVDLVKKVGITGKGSALASLSDEEAQKVRDHLSGAGKPEPVAAPGYGEIAVGWLCVSTLIVELSLSSTKA